MTWGEPEEVTNVDFSQIHFCDHVPFGARCRQQFGGGWRHLWVMWITKWREQVLWPFWRIRCPFGVHQDAIWRVIRADGSRGAWVTCLACGRERMPSEYELEKNPEIQFKIGEDET